MFLGNIEQTRGPRWKGFLIFYPVYTAFFNCLTYSFKKRNKLLWKTSVLKACFLMGGWRLFCLAKSKHFRSSTLVGNWSTELFIASWAFYIVSHWIIYGRAQVALMTSRSWLLWDPIKQDLVFIFKWILFWLFNFLPPPCWRWPMEWEPKCGSPSLCVCDRRFCKVSSQPAFYLQPCFPTGTWLRLCVADPG